MNNAYTEKIDTFYIMGVDVTVVPEGSSIVLGEPENVAGVKLHKYTKLSKNKFSIEYGIASNHDIPICPYCGKLVPKEDCCDHIRKIVSLDEATVVFDRWQEHVLKGEEFSLCYYPPEYLANEEKIDSEAKDDVADNTLTEDEIASVDHVIGKLLSNLMNPSNKPYVTKLSRLHNLLYPFSEDAGI